MADIIVFKSGTVVTFPVSPDDPLATYQQLLDPAELHNLSDLAIVRNTAKTYPGLSRDNLRTVVSGILAASQTDKIIQLTFPDIVVDVGATLAIAGPITKITAGNVIILGEIHITGSLDLTCSSLGGIAPPVVTSINPPVGSTVGGTQVVISGSGFDATTAVYFGGTPAAQVAVDPAIQSITAWAPPHAAGAVDITVVSQDGVLGSATSPADVFTYAYLPGVSSIEVNPAVIWAGQSAAGTITLDEPAAAGGASVALTLLGPSAAGVTVPAAVAIGAGESSAAFSIDTAPTALVGGVLISGTGPDGLAQSATLQIGGNDIFVSFPSLLIDNGLQTGQTAEGTVFVSTPAPAAGGVIQLGTSNPNAVSVPADIPLLAGSTSASFVITALDRPTVGVTISASYDGNSASSQPFTVLPGLVRK